MITTFSLFDTGAEVKPQGTRKLIAEIKKPQDLVWFKGRQVDAAFLSNHYTQAVDDYKSTQSAMAAHLPDYTDETAELPICEGTGEILNDSNGRRTLPWKEHKEESTALANLFRQALAVDPTLTTEERLLNLEDCASFLEFLRDTAQAMKLKRANFCKMRLCPMCSWRRSMKLFGQTARVAGEILDRYPKTRFIFVTFTVKNCSADDLKNTLKRMDKAFKYITSAGQTFAPAKGLKKNLLGYMRATEITYNQQANTYHPHFHILMAVKSTYFKGQAYLNHEKWQALWRDAAGLDYEPQVRAEAVTDKGKGMAGAVAETAKYPVKVADLLKITDKKKAVAALITLHHAMENRRMVTFGGVFKTIRAELKMQNVEAENADLGDTEQDKEKAFVPVERVFFRWRVKVGAYIC